ncbi:unnamed protein product [Paramecium primaurelia]|uniref:intramembrane prenyl-peptidase Rce1 n=2 Tax=Paramecium TaxID=5884 RepID=A0A8S1RWK7_9CILI|nr:unnamed protein product [Paramecium primaurelia]CAD8131790.1 unnamed protein product [Paramecium pentaurelia]
MMNTINQSSAYLHTLIYVSSYIISKSIYRLYKERQFGESSSNQKKGRYQRKRIKILLLGFPTFLCLIHSYTTMYQSYKFDLKTIIQWNNNSKVCMGIAISFYMSFVLYGGPIYHEFWNGNLKKKLGKLQFNKFRWDYFSKIVVTPLIEELIFRGFTNNSFNPEYKNNYFYMIYSTFLYLLVGLILFEPKQLTSNKWNYIKQILKSLSLGVYLSYVLVQTETLIAVIINHGCINFMGSPNIKDLLKGNYSRELRFKIMRFYFLGFLAFLIFCLLVL